MCLNISQLNPGTCVHNLGSLPTCQERGIKHGMAKQVEGINLRFICLFR